MPIANFDIISLMYKYLKKYTKNSVLENWLEQTEAKWQNPPDFELDKSKLKHLAIICDGNRRAAQQLNLNPYFGHRVGVKTIRGIARACRKWDIDILTFWVWSTENWGRDKNQVKFVMNLAQESLSEDNLLNELIDDQVKFMHIGRKDRLPNKLKEILDELEANTRKFSKYKLNLALDYGGVDEMNRAVEKMLLNNARPEKLFDYLDTAGQPLPDLVIRTGMDDNEIIHTSGFMPLQTAYSGWIFLNDLFPNLTPESLLSAIKTFVNYQRRNGK